MSVDQSDYNPWDEFRRVAEQYRLESIQIVSPTRKRAVYVVKHVREDAVIFHRLSESSDQRVSDDVIDRVWMDLSRAGGEIDVEKMLPNNRYSRLIRWGVLQAPWLIYHISRDMALDARDEENVLSAVMDACDQCGAWPSIQATADAQRRLLAATVQAIGAGQIRENQISPTALLPYLGDYVGNSGDSARSKATADGFYHLSSLHIWLCSMVDPLKRSTSTLGVPYEQLEQSVRYARLKEPVWQLLQNADHREAVLKHLGGERKTRITNMPSKINLNKELLRRAVDKVIRPQLIDAGRLQNKKQEGWQHQIVMPKVAPLLKREALVESGGTNVKRAYESTMNLISKQETIFAGSFVALTDSKDILDHTLDLLYGDGSEAERMDAFVHWANAGDEDGKQRRINATVASVLLAISNPRRYAFCKPKAYKQAAEALLGEFVKPGQASYGERQAHCSEFYKAALAFMVNECDLPFTDLMHVHIAFYVMSRSEEFGLPTWEQLANDDYEVSPEPVKTIMPRTLNQILYGPPGTGKTYDAVRRAVRLCDGDIPDGDSAVTARLRELVDEGRIAMVTFHQSFGYEDFVEGIRPVLAGSNDDDLDDDSSAGVSGQIQYQCKLGVFREICQYASSHIEVSVSPEPVDETRTVWKMSLGDSNKKAHDKIYEEGLESERLLLGYGRLVDYTGCDNKRQVLKAFVEQYPEDKRANTNADYLNRLKNEMKIGDYVVIPKGLDAFRAIGRVIGEYVYDAERDGFRHTRSVKWLFRKDESLPVKRISGKRLSQSTLYRIDPTALRWDAIKGLLNPGKSKSEANKPHVLIIDEINRANVSKVFGELITLLEPDKRIGSDNELRVQLPYSNDLFGVPSNLYVIGTMNTADRSIALIDTAFRRRFSFEEVMPDIGVIEEVVGDEGEIDGVSVSTLLDVINQRIELLYDRDHQLGHSFFLKVKSIDDLKGVFLKAVIPMLQEYFYGDWPRVAAVLGCPYDAETGGPLHKTSSPLIIAKRLDASILNSDGGYSVSDVRYEINPDFESAEDDDLVAFFDGVLNGIKVGSA